MGAFDGRPLRVAAFARLWGAGSVTVFGSQLTAVAVPLRIYGLTGSSAYVGLASLVGFGPMVVAALWCGALADVVDRRRMLLVTSGGIGMTSLLMWALATAGPESMLVLVGVQQALFGANAATSGAVVPRLVTPDLLPAANALQSVSVWFAGIAGPLLAGVLMPVTGAGTLFLLDAVAMCPTLWAVWRLPALPPPASPTVRAPGVMAGVRYLLRHQILLVAYLTDFAALFFGLPTSLFPQLAHQRFGDPAAGGAVAGEAVAGMLFAAISAGGVVAALVAGLYSGSRRAGCGSRRAGCGSRRAGAMMAGAAVAWGLAITGLGVVGSLPAVGSLRVAGSPRVAGALPAALVLLAVAGAALVVLGVFRKLILQAVAVDEMRGRLQGIDLAVAAGGPRLASAAHGVAGAVWGPARAVTGGGLLVVAAMLVLLVAFPGFARYGVK